VVELAPEMLRAAGEYRDENRNVLDYPGLRVQVEDARNYLLRTEEQYDIITTDATHPANASSWTLFTEEFYRGVRDHLAPDGVFLQWVPLHSMRVEDYRAILRTMQSVFPNATLWYTGGTHTLLLATPEPLTAAALEEKLRSASTDGALREDLQGAQGVMRHWIMSADQLREFVGAGRIVRDNDAYFLPDNSEMESLIGVIQLAAIRAQR
jgi:spermidine synthase